MPSSDTADRFRLYLQSNPALVVVLDREGRIAELNPAGAELLGVDAPGIVGADWFRFVPADEREATRHVFQRVMAGDLPAFGTHENDVVTAGGERRTLVWRNAVLRGPDGTVTAGISTGVDVTERMRATLRYHQLFEHMTEGFAVHEILLDPAGRPVDYRFLQVNAAFERLTGLEAGTVVGRRVLEVIPGLEPVFIERYGRVALTGEPVRFEQRSGPLGRVYVVNAYRPEPGRFACTFTDVTEQRATLEALGAALRRAEASEQSLRLVASHARDVIWAYDLQEGRFTYMSPSIEGLRGISVEEALAEPMEANLTPESMRRAAVILARIGTHEEENPHVGIYDMPCRDGQVKQVEIIASYESGGGGQPPTVFGITRDVTERIRTERALEASEALYRSLFNAVPSGVVLTDEGGRILAFNDRAAAELGYTREEFAKLAIWDIDPTDDEAAVTASVTRVLHEGSLDFDVRHRNRSGELRDVRVRAVRVNREQGPAVLAIWEDTTEERRATRAREEMAERLRESQKLESIGRLAGGVAHDLNNILVVLMGCADGLRRSLQSGRPPEAEDVDELAAGARRARDLTEQLLAYARRRVVAPVRLDLNEQVRQAERMLHRLIGENVALTLNLAPGILPTTFDPGQLSQVLVNLVLNARDAMPDGGRLTISTKDAEDGDGPVAGWQGGPVPQGSYVRLTVEDSGSGIPPELGQTVFEPFVTTKPAGKGTGLGLATVHGIVQQAGGAIRYRSEPGRGTVFEVVLPRATGEPVASGPAPSPLAPALRPGGQVLLVEDDPHVRAMVERALRRGGYEVLAAESGEGALEMLRLPGVAPRILVTDVVMRGLNGRQVAEAVQRVRPGIPVLFMSGYAHDIVVRHGSVEPGLHLIEKPFTGEELLERVQGLIATG